MTPIEPVLIAIHVDDPALKERLTDLLGSVDWLSLVREIQDADLVLSTARSVTDNVNLTAREREVVALLAEGLSNKAIARKLGISVDTAKYHVGRVIDKLDATSRTEAVTHAARRGVILL
jgi:DNA-binding CsgD family transcriptional regulator